jgi:predicted transcriptional regulator
MQLHLLEDNSLIVYKALGSKTRLNILRILADTPSTASELTQRLDLSKAIMSRHIKILELANLIHMSNSYASSDQRKKVYTLRVDKVNINFPKKIYHPYQKKVSDIQLGYFSDFDATPSCGLASKEHIIGMMDDPRTFVSNERIQASLLWLSSGFVEYKIPNLLDANQHPQMLELSLEIASEFPMHNNIWPSDITFWINAQEVGTWTSPGNYADVRGKLTPPWWEKNLSQYGLLKHLRITHDDTGIDGDRLSDVTLSNLNLSDSPFITLRIGVKANAINKGGLTIFGEHFGNHNQNILLSLYYIEREALETD